MFEDAYACHIESLVAALPRELPWPGSILAFLEIIRLPLVPLLPSDQLGRRHVLLVEPLHAVLTLIGLAKLQLPHFEFTQVDIRIRIIRQLIPPVHLWYMVA